MKIFNNVKVTKKLGLLLVVMLVGFSFIGSTYLNIIQAETKVHTTVQTLGRFHLEIENIMLLLGETVTHQRDFLLNQRLEDLEAFEETVETTRENLESFGKQVDNAELKQLVSYVRDSLNDYHTSVSN